LFDILQSIKQVKNAEHNNYNINMSKERITKSRLLETLNGKVMSKSQLADELDVDRMDLTSIIDQLLEKEGRIGIAIDHAASNNQVMAEHTYKYYRNEDAQYLENEGRLSKPKYIMPSARLIEVLDELLSLR